MCRCGVICAVSGVKGNEWMRIIDEGDVRREGKRITVVTLGVVDMCGNHISPHLIVWAWEDTSWRYTWLGFVGRQFSATHSKYASMQTTWHCQPSTTIWTIFADLFTVWMHALSMDIWRVREPSLQTRFMSRVHISSIRKVLDQWWQITLFACPLLRRRLNRHFNWLVSEALVYHDSPYIRSLPVFSCDLRLQLFLLLIKETSLVTELSWDWTLPHLKVSR